MALIKADRVKETSTSETTANFILGGAATGYRAFSSVCAIGDTFYYAISHQTLNQWECGLGTYGAGNVLERTTVHSSSNSGAKVNFSAGTKECFLTLTARHLDRIQDNGQSTAIGSKTSVVAVNDSATLPDLDLQFADLKTLTAKYGPTPSYSRASTGTYFNASGVLTSAAINEPRFDHVFENGVWVSKGLLIEEQRTNQLANSNNFSSAFPTGGAQWSSGAAASPDGTSNGWKLFESAPASGSVDQRKYNTVSFSGAQSSFSIYAKAAERRRILLFVNGPNKGAWFDLVSKTCAEDPAYPGGTPIIQDVGNGWCRCTIVTPGPFGGITNLQIQLLLDGATSNPNRVGDGVSGVYLAFAQHEIGAFPTSYIPTTTTSVVRSADVCQITGSAFTNLWNATEGSFASEVYPVGDNSISNQAIISANNGTFANVVGHMRNIMNTNGDYGAFVRNSSVTQVQISRPAGSMPAFTSSKTAFGFKNNDFADSLNGISPLTDTSGTIPTAVDRFTIGDFHTNASTYFNGCISRIRYFRSRLDNTQLVNLSGGINSLAFKTVTGSGSVTVANEYSNINVSVPNPLPITNGGTNATTQLAAVTNLVGNPPNDGGQYTLASKKTSGTPTFYWVDGTGYAPTLDLLFAADKSLTAYKGPTPTFSRASSGSFFDSTGVLRIQGYNILQYSEDFDNAYWTKSLTTILSNVAIAPNGQMTADKIVETQASGFHSVNRTTGVSSGASSTASIYLKAGERTFASFEIVDNFRAVINLIDGTVVSNTLASSTVTTENVGNGWWRVKYTANSSAIGRLIIYTLPTSTFGSYSGDGSSGIFAWGAQVESGSNANLYSATTNAANSAPRFNHTYNGTSWVSRGLLVEEQRTNLNLRSEEFDNAAWAKSRATITANDITSPDGLITADKFTGSTTDAVNNAFAYNNSIITFSGTALTCSIFYKKGNTEFATISIYGTGFSNGYRQFFNLTTGAVASGSGIGANWSKTAATIQNVGNGWYRCTLSVSIAGGANQAYVLFEPIVRTDGGNGVTTGDFTYAWGAQLEAGAFPTSYIPTTSASVTRSADVCQIYGSDFQTFWNSSEGTFVIEYDKISNSGFGYQFSASNYVYQSVYGRFAEPNETASLWNGTQQANLTTTPAAAGTMVKKAIAYKLNDFAMSYNGASALTDTSCTMPVGVVYLDIGNSNLESWYHNGHITRLRYYPVRLPNATLQVLST